jgi:hypothetical protein
MPIGSHNFDWSEPLGPGLGVDHRSRNRNMDLQTKRGDRPIRLNSRSPLTNAAGAALATGNLIGMQCKPGAGGGGSATASVKAAEFSPRFRDGTAGGNLIGISVDPILQGSSGAGGNLSGAMRGIEVTLTDGNGGTRTITGRSAFIRFFHQLATKTFTNGLFGLEFAAKGGGVAWDGAMYLDAEAGLAAASSGGGASLPANVGWIRVKVGSEFLKIPLYND